MLTNKVDTNQMPERLNPGNESRKAAPDRDASAAGPAEVKTDPSSLVTLSPHFSNLDGFAAKTDASNRLAKHIRNLDRRMQGMERQIERMRKPLALIVKNFPPFPPESAERARMLKNFSGFRKLIAQLTSPPEETRLPNGAPSAAIPEIDSGLKHIGQIDIPDLSPAADDSEVRDAWASLGTVQQNLSEQRMGLMAGAYRYSGQFDFQFEKRYESFADDIEAAEHRSVQVKQILTLEVSASLTGSPTLFQSLFSE